MHDYARLDDAIVTTLRNGIADLRASDETLSLIACGMVEDLTGFFIAGAGTAWLRQLTGSDADRAQWAWSPSEWPLEAEDETDSAPGRVTSAIWELSGTQAALDGTGQELDEEALSELRSAYEARIVAALQQLQSDGGLVNANGTTVWAWLHSADAADEDLDDRTFRLLQPGEIADDFALRYDGNTSQLIARLS